MDIRPLTARADVRDAIRAHGHAWQEAYDDIVADAVLDRISTDPDAKDVDRWLDRFPEEHGVTLGVAAEGAVRGYILVRWAETKPFVGSEEAGLKEIYVHPEWWGEGLGGALLDDAIERVPADVRGMVLEVLADNDRARGFYEAYGFELARGGTTEIGDRTYETAIYRRTLDP